MELVHTSGRTYAECVTLIAAEMRLRRVVPFLGAGVSSAQPSGLPMAGALNGPLVKMLLEMDPRSGAIQALIRPQLEDAPSERILDAFQAVYGPKALDWLEALEGGNPNENHLGFAALAKAGYLAHLITLNFDCLLESAIKETGCRCTTEWTMEPRSFPTGDGPTVCRITKPHGSILPDPATRFLYLGATISQVGTHVSRRTRHALHAIFSQCPTVLVAGYRGSDWDILPILKDRHNDLERVVWIQHSNRQPMSLEIDTWLRGLGERAIWLRGDCRELVGDLCKAVGVKPELPVEKTHPWPPLDPAKHFGDQVRNRFVLAELVHHDSVKAAILESLDPGGAPELKARRLMAQAAIQHTAHNPRGALQINREAWQLKRRHRIDEAKKYDELLWIGYEHLCLAKHSSFEGLWEWLQAAGDVLTGACLIGYSAWSGHGRGRDQREALAVYYAADLVHSWSSVLVERGPETVRRWRLLFRLISWVYTFARYLDPDRMEWEYYRMRWREAQMLGSVKLDYAEVRAELLGILSSSRMVRTQDQLGNPHVYLALLDFTQRRYGPQIAEELAEAERIWSSEGSSSGSGLRRVELYRRYCLGPTVPRADS